MEKSAKASYKQRHMNRQRLRPWLFSFTIMLMKYTNGQTTTSLKDVIGLAQSQSLQYKAEQTKKEVSYDEYFSYLSDRKPQVSLYGNAPNFIHQYSAITQPDGSIAYLPVKQNVADIGFSLSQQIPFTGGTIALNTDLNRYDDFQGKNFQYNGTPVFLSIAQPVFGVNSLKWEKKIEPLKLEESKRAYAEDLENIAQEAAGLFFNALEAQENIRISEFNVKHTEENYEIEKKRVALGTTTEDKVLQLELQVLTSRQNLQKALYNYEIGLLNLKAFLGSKDSTHLSLVTPDDIPVFDVNLDQALAFAKQARPEYIAFERKRLQAEEAVAIAKAAKQQVNINATFGLNRAGTNLQEIYSSPKDQETFSIGFNVPIIDWGRRSAALNTARANLKLTEYNNEIDEINQDQEITTLVRNIPLLRGDVDLTAKRDSVAERRYSIANGLYQRGKLTVTELNLAQNEKDNARQEFINSLKSFWDAYYLLRKITLYDFEHHNSLYP
jgi:outer membrane protein TolC